MKLEGLVVRVYFKSKGGVLSIKHKGRVVAYLEDIYLEDAKFVVSQNARHKYVLSDKGATHAYIQGRVIQPMNISCDRPITYDPYRFETYSYMQSGKPVHVARYCYIDRDKAYVI